MEIHFEFQIATGKASFEMKRFYSLQEGKKREKKLFTENKSSGRNRSRRTELEIPSIAEQKDMHRAFTMQRVGKCCQKVASTLIILQNAQKCQKKADKVSK